MYIANSTPPVKNAHFKDCLSDSADFSLPNYNISVWKSAIFITSLKLGQRNTGWDLWNVANFLSQPLFLLIWKNKMKICTIDFTTKTYVVYFCAFLYVIDWFDKHFTSLNMSKESITYIYIFFWVIYKLHVVFQNKP